MYGEISPQAASRYPLAEFTDAYGTAQETATVARVTTDDPSAAESGGRPAAAVPVSLETRAFGQIAGRLAAAASRRRDRLVAEPRLPGARAQRSSWCGAPEVPERAPILARRRDAAGRGPRRQPLLAAGRGRPERRRRGRCAQPPAGPRALAARIPARHADRHQRPRARLQPASRRAAGRSAGRGPRRRRRSTRRRPGACQCQAARGQARAHDDRPRTSSRPR